MEETKLKEQINAVVEVREHFDKLATFKKDALAKWEYDNNELLAEIILCTSVKAEAEDKLRELALQAYAETGEKAVAPGVGIRVRTLLGYSTKEAFEWAIEHKLALKLDPSAFEKIAKTSNIPFVSMTEEPTATIATELARVE
uniref:Uncharacterized protein n=1 Tax=viral metagenome TaxID=1070528 RepID=A0A6M3L1I4_9ZZZZ